MPAVLPHGRLLRAFFDDAEVASRALGIVLTKRGKHEGEEIRCAACRSNAPTNISTA